MARKHARKGDEASIDMTPMLDIVFIMLIFFIVTTSFVKEAGLEVRRPPAETALPQVRGNVMIGVSENGDIYMLKRKVEVDQVRVLVQQAKAENPEGSVVIIADEQAPTSVVVRVMDEARLAGAEQVAVAAREASGS